MKYIPKADVSLTPEQLNASAGLRCFRNPDLDSRPMTRTWFPDAGAGTDDADAILTQFRSMAEGGIAGVEVTLLGDDSGNLDAENYGWGTPNWVKTMKKVLKAARQIEGGFKIDFTITAHWPLIVNTIDPNDPAASTNMVYTWKKLRPEDGIVELPLPETNLYDSGRNPFIFKDTLCGAITATVADTPLPELKNEMFGMPDQNSLHHFGPERTMFDGKIMGGPGGSGGFPPMPEPKHVVPFVLELDSLKNVTGLTGQAEGKGWACGVPDAAALQKWYDGQISEAAVLDVFGPPADETNMLDAKRDRDLNRKRMADFQPVYTLDATGLAAAAADDALPQPGDTVVICCYYRGTGQIFSGGFKSRLMKNMTYATNYFTVAGAKAVTDYWDTYMLSDPELRELMELNAEEVGGAIFEDSIELHSNGANWGAEFEQDISARMGCDAVRLLPVITGLYFDDAARAARILEEYRIAEGGMYQDNHIGHLNRWTATFGYQYRAQAGMPGINSVGANTATGITEGDNGTFKDANRRLAGAVNMVPSKKFHSFESNTFTGFPFPWSLLAQECHYDASTGTNRLIFHGTAYCKNVHSFYSWWPGWNWGGGGGKAYDFMAWDKRICWWDDAHVMTDYLSRLCGILQNIQAKPDFAAIIDSSEGMLGGSSNYQALTDMGYSYNVLGDFSLTLPTAEVTNGLLYEGGPAYRALLLKDMTSMRYATAVKIAELAAAGLPVIFDGMVPSRVTGMEKPGQDDAALKTVLDGLLAMPNVYVVTDPAALKAQLAGLGITPAAAYSCAGLEASHLQDAAGDYYSFYNDTLETVTVPVTLSGSGTLVQLDCWNGRLLPVAADGNTFTLELAAQDMKFYALLRDAAPAALTTATAQAPVTIDSYDIEIESFGPPAPGDAEYDPETPINSHRELISFAAVPTGTTWAELPATEAQLQQLRVGSMADVSGRSAYTMTFELPEGITAVELAVGHNDRDFLVGGSLNGSALPCFSCMVDRLMVTEGLKAGTNTLVLKLDTILTNRLNYESPGFLAKADLSLMSFGGGARDYSGRHRHGIESVTITPYI